MPTEQAVNPWLQLPIIPYLLIFLIFYFLVIKPQRDKQRQHKDTLKNLKKNDEVVTAAGIHGIVALVKETTVMVRVDDNVKIEFDKEAIASVVKAKD
ncbi:MAG: preprotein translocase subunit YajC [Omnitrophica WOR_2 bacterium RIFCSPHIGHO2_02_FULL_50_17]|nr:MAG: preprotein translocase subunit YajC [Omnitrophica WOR_2 bacterium RIFCSPHIGHO2_02_FULL_50_17]